MIIAIDTNCILPGQVGGLENYTLGLVRAVAERADWIDSVVLFTRPENDELFRPFCGPRCRAVLIPRPVFNGKPVMNWAVLLASHPQEGKRILEAYQRSKREMMEGCGADLVHFPGNAINPIDLSLPAVLNIHDLQHRHFPQYFTPDDLANREKWWPAAARRADAVIATTPYVAQDIQREMGVGQERLFVAHPPVDGYFREAPAKAALDELRRRLKLPGTVFLYPAAAWPHKNHERLVRAFAQAKIADVHLVLTGAGQEHSKVRQLADELGAGQSVRILGRIEKADLRRLYYLATALVLPSEYEASSFPIMEAMLSGCPVASSNVTSLPDLVGDAGILFDPHDIDAMASAMRRLAQDAELRRTLAERGRRRMEGYTEENYLAGIQRVYAHARSTAARRLAA